MQRKPNEGKYTEVSIRVRYRMSRSCSKHLVAVVYTRNLQILLGKCSNCCCFHLHQDWAWCWSCTMQKDTSPYREIVVPGNISSKIHKILIIVFLSSAPFKANTEKGDRILDRYQNNKRNLTPERLKFGKFSNLFHPSLWTCHKLGICIHHLIDLQTFANT